VAEEELFERPTSEQVALKYSVADASELDRYLQTMAGLGFDPNQMPSRGQDRYLQTMAGLGFDPNQMPSRGSQASAIDMSMAAESLSAFYDHGSALGAVVDETTGKQPEQLPTLVTAQDTDAGSPSPFDKYVDEMVLASQPHPSAASRQKISDARFVPFARQTSQPQPVAQVTITQVRNFKFSQLMQTWAEGAPASAPPTE
jgi:hypothetical protein